MGWLALGLIGAGAAVLLAMAGLPRRLGALSGAALMLGSAGYALQGRPLLGGGDVRIGQRDGTPDPGLLAFRDEVLRPRPATARTLHAADGRLRQGDASGAAAILLAAIQRTPRDPALWAGLGAALTVHDRQPSPAALFAFRRAFSLAPRDPGPPFLLGAAYLDAGQLPAAEQAWAQALLLAPANAPYRRTLADQLALVRQVRVMTDAGR